MSKSGYRFVPLNTKVVPAPVSLDEIRHDRPVPGMLSGELTVEWTAETPICVASGEKNDKGEQENVFIADVEKGKSGKYVLPGSTTAGAIHAVSEIASFAHLGRINADRKYGKRDMLGRNQGGIGDDEDNPVRLDISTNRIRMAWLEWVPDNPDAPKVGTLEKGEGSWRIYHAADNMRRENIYLVRFGDLSTYYQIDMAEWAHKRLSDKAAILSKSDPISMVRMDGKPIARSSYKKAFQGPLDVSAGPDVVSGYVVCTGPTVSVDTPKAHEYLFIPPKRDATSFEVHPEIMREFNKLYTTPSNDGGVPLENWQFWLSQIGHKDWLGKAKKINDRAYDNQFGRRIPVFYTAIDGTDIYALAEAKTMHEAGVCLSLSPVMRMPNVYSVGDIAKRTYNLDGEEKYYVPGFVDGGLGWDMPTALFGAVEGTDQDKLASDAHDVRAALKGRVAFGFAISENATEDSAKTGVFGVPRPSFDPYYLTGTDGYNDPNSRLSGRKRYPVRSNVSTFEIPNDNTDVQETVRFLKPGAKFTQKIKFKNLKKEELGLLLWSICLGDPDKESSHLHAIGRAKGHGYGAMRTAITEIRGADQRDAFSAVADFKAYILRDIGETDTRFEDLEPIKSLLDYSDPSQGDQNSAMLEYPQLDDFAKIRDRHSKLSKF